MKNLIKKILFKLFDKLNKNHQSYIYNNYRKKYKISSNFRFNGEKIILYGEGEIYLKSNSYIGHFSTIEAAQKMKVVIGENTSISHNVRIYSSTKASNQKFDKEKKSFNKGNVVIGNGVWIGVNCIILPGVIVGDNAIIGANSVVNKNIPENSICIGNPIKIIKNNRFND